VAVAAAKEEEEEVVHAVVDGELVSHVKAVH
jgi:hypothetical protein